MLLFQVSITYSINFGVKWLHSPVKTDFVAAIKQLDLKNLYFFAVNVRKTPQKKSLTEDKRQI